MPDQKFPYLVPQKKDFKAFVARVEAAGTDFDLITRGKTLSKYWERMSFSVKPDDASDHPWKLGDVAHWHLMLGLTSDRALEVMPRISPSTCELLPGTLDGRPIGILNVFGAVEKKDLAQLNNVDLFRVRPVCFDVIATQRAKDAIESAGISGVWFLKVREADVA
jgi:hypothetical protein